MGAVHDRMEKDLRICRLAESTRSGYLAWARCFLAYHRRPPAEIRLWFIRDRAGCGPWPSGHDSLRVKPATPAFHPLPTARLPVDCPSIRCSEYPAPTNMSGGPKSDATHQPT